MFGIDPSPPVIVSTETTLTTCRTKEEQSAYDDLLQKISLRSEGDDTFDYIVPHSEDPLVQTFLDFTDFVLDVFNRAEDNQRLCVGGTIVQVDDATRARYNCTKITYRMEEVLGLSLRAKCRYLFLSRDDISKVEELGKKMWKEDHISDETFRDIKNLDQTFLHMTMMNRWGKDFPRFSDQPVRDSINAKLPNGITVAPKVRACFPSPDLLRCVKVLSEEVLQGIEISRKRSELDTNTLAFQEFRSAMQLWRTGEDLSQVSADVD